MRNAEHGLPQHLSGWRDVLKRTYNYETPFLLAKESSGRHLEVRGIALLNGVRLVQAVDQISELV